MSDNKGFSTLNEQLQNEAPVIDTNYGEPEMPKQPLPQDQEVKTATLTSRLTQNQAPVDNGQTTIKGYSAAKFEEALGRTNRHAGNRAGNQQAYYEAFSELFEKHQDFFAELPEDSNYSAKLYNVAAERYGLGKGCIIIAAEIDDVKYGYVIILENTGSKLGRAYLKGQNTRGRNVESVPATPDMITNDKFNRVISSNFGFLTATADNSQKGYNYTYLPESIAANNTPAIYNMIANACDCICAQHASLNLVPDEIPLRAYTVLGTLNKQANFQTSSDTVDAFGSPVRSDASFSLVTGLRDSNEYNLNQSQKEICNVTVYAETTYSEEPILNEAGRHFIPRIRVTSIDSDSAAPSLRDTLLALIETYSYSYDGTWQYVLNPLNMMAAGKNMNDILTDAPALIGKDGNPIVVDLNNNPADWHNHAKLTFAPEPVYSVIVQEGGPLNWGALATLVSAAEYAEISEEIAVEINNMTEGRFIKECQRLGLTSAGLFEPRIDYSHNGYYISKDGTRKPLSDIDYNFLATHYAGSALDAQRRMDWDDTFNLNIEVGTRLNRREKLIREMVGESNVVINGYNKILDIDPLVHRAAFLAIRGCDFNPQGGQRLQADKVRQRGNPWVTSAANRIATIHRTAPPARVYNGY